MVLCEAFTHKITDRGVHKPERGDARFVTFNSRISIQSNLIM